MCDLDKAMHTVLHSVHKKLQLLSWEFKVSAIATFFLDGLPSANRDHHQIGACYCFLDLSAVVRITNGVVTT
jgi:hypothetical protein